MTAQARLLPDGQRLHLQHGPIDVILGIDGLDRAEGFRAATACFATILDGLVAELPALRLETGPALSGPVARRMRAATLPYRPAFITPMAAVAGAVADDLIATVAPLPGIARAYANNGGDIALHLAPGQRFDAAMPAGRIAVTHADPVRGIATSGWRGRSHSLGIADAVTVLAASAAAADAAATMIANAVDLPGHPGITRRPARALAPDSDLGDLPVTTDVPPLSPAEIARALDAGTAFAETCRTRGLIVAATLTLASATRTVSAQKDRLDA